jgi:ubiquinone biosynthesis protein COQ9
MTDISKKHREARELFLQHLAVLLETNNWGAELLKLTEEKCKFLANYHLVLFPEGMEQITREFESWQDLQMLELLAKEEKPQKIRSKIARALESRLMNVAPKTIIFKQNALFLEPCNLVLGAKSYARTCDLIWRYAGDKSDDFNYYTKRGLLLGVYASARLFYLADDSKDFIKTKEFIANSLDGIINIASLKNKLPSLEDIPILRMF